MRVVQIIDSLDAGGAERMAINYANALSEKITLSALITTRKEGVLKKQLNSRVSYLFLNKKHTFDLKSIFKLKSFVEENKITIVHAHGTSFFLAVLLKFICPKIKLIWHEHYGARVDESIVSNLILTISSFFFSSVFVVNHQLEIWVKNKLLVKKVYCVPNFTVFEENYDKSTFLKGDREKRMVCLANLKNPKNHIAILIAFKELKLHKLGWSLHLIGKDYNDSYSIELKNFINKNKLQNSIFIYGSKNDVQHILSQSTIGILASTHEGFPVTLLEYGLAKLPVLSTNVGFCTSIITDNFNGLLFDPFNCMHLKAQLEKMILAQSLRVNFGLRLNRFVLENYSQDKVLHYLLSRYSIV